MGSVTSRTSSPSTEHSPEAPHHGADERAPFPSRARISSSESGTSWYGYRCRRPSGRGATRDTGGQRPVSVEPLVLQCPVGSHQTGSSVVKPSGKIKMSAVLCRGVTSRRPRTTSAARGINRERL